MKDIHKILSNYPKSRPDLPLKYKQIHVEHYKDNRSAKEVIGKFVHLCESWMHIKVAEDIKYMSSPPSTLEIGAGSLNHLAYENIMQVYDVVEPFIELYAQSNYKNRVRNFFEDIKEVNGKYERIISIATFEHLQDLPRIVAQSGLLLKSEGCLRVAIPAEGNTTWKLAYTLSSGVSFYLKYKLNYEILMRYEHINNWKEIKAVLSYFFKDIKGKYCGLNQNLSIYHFYECSEPIVNRCLKYIENVD